MDESGSKGAQNDVFIRSGTTSGLGSPVLSHLWSQIGRIFKALSALRGAKIAQHGLKMGSFHLFVHPK